ncbi:MAG: hypothetical protein U9P00_12925 [Pseudomonadota bacterium]|nr:hypothetical protein [Pseudomonadota bacterium]
MKYLKNKSTAIATAMSLLVAVPGVVTAKNGTNTPYEVWGSDQSNSVPDKSVGKDGSFIWIWNSEDVDKQITKGTEALPLGCDGNDVPGDGPCDIKHVFPAGLAQHDGSGLTGETLGSLSAGGGFGKLHGMLADPQNLYMNFNSFVTDGTGGYIGIMDGRTKEAVALFRVTEVAAGVRRSLHMSFWNYDGSALLLANLHGKILERIDITRDADGNITNANFNRAASLGVGKAQVVTEDATAFVGNNAHDNPLVSTVSGSYDAGAFSDLTPNNFCKENSCGLGNGDAANGGRPNNVIVCPIVSDNGNAYITMGGGGLLIADTSTTPMSLTGEYGANVVNGAGCGGVQVGDYMWLDAGASAGGGGLTQSTFTQYTFDDTAYSSVQAPDMPAPLTVYKDTFTEDIDGTGANTHTLGNLDGPGGNVNAMVNDTGQLPGVSTRRDAHGMARTVDGKYIHTVDRIQNVAEVFDTDSMTWVGTYDLTSKNGNGTGGDGPCAAMSVTDDPGLPGNDPAPDLMDTTPDGKYLVVALRGPVPASVLHAAQGSCPGVGMIRLLDDGERGKLATVLRSSHQVPTTQSSTAVGGHDYTGDERSDIHGASVRDRVEDM